MVRDRWWVLLAWAFGVACGSSTGHEGGVGGAGAAGESASLAGQAGAPDEASAGEAGEGGTAGAGGAGGAGGAPDAMGGEAGALESEGEVPPIPPRDETELAEPAAEAGFIEIEPHAYTSFRFMNPVESARARLFYRFIPADVDAKSKPVFVIFNGGPGYTSMLLLTFGTGPLTLDADAPLAAPVRNESSFTALGNLLYIDARHTGFSYGVADDVSDAEERGAAFSEANFNPGVDAADFVRVLLRVLARQPALENNPVVLVGESYGGTRAGAMLELLLGTDGWLYRDAALQEEIAAHYRNVFASVPEQFFGAKLFSQQFGWQVLIEPGITGELQTKAAGLQKAARDARMAAALGIDQQTLTNERCTDNRSKSRAWCDALDPAIAQSLLEPERYAAWMGVAPTAVPGLSASDRARGFRFKTDGGTHDPEPAAWLAALGTLPVWDRYFSPSTGERVPDGFKLVFAGTPVYGLSFTRSVRRVNTLITNAAFDANVPGEAIVPSLQTLIQEYPQLAGGLSHAEYVGKDPEQISERIRLTFDRSPGLGPAAERIVYFPQYAASGHMVTLSEPGKLREDVRQFLSETGL